MADGQTSSAMASKIRDVGRLAVEREKEGKDKAKEGEREKEGEAKEADKMDTKA